MTISETIRELLLGHTVTDIGQLSKYTKTVLKRAVKRQYVDTFLDYHWPNPKRSYFLRSRQGLKQMVYKCHNEEWAQ